MNEIHSCSYYCDRPACIKAQRDELREKLARQEQESFSPEAIRATQAAWKMGYDAAKAEQPEQEPVGTVSVETKNDRRTYQFTATKRLPDGILDIYTAPPQPTEQEPFEDLATELFVIAQISPADDGFSETIERIESWLREHFSTPPQRKPLTDEEIAETLGFGEHTTATTRAILTHAARAIEAKLKERNT